MYAYMYACSIVSDSLWPPWTVAHQTPLSIEFSRQEYWSGLPFPTPGDLPDLGIELSSRASPALVGGFFLTTGPPGKLMIGLAKSNFSLFLILGNVSTGTLVFQKGGWVNFSLTCLITMAPANKWLEVARDGWMLEGGRQGWEGSG